MGTPQWPDSTPIRGVEVLPGPDQSGYTISLDYDLSPPNDANEEPNAAYLSQIVSLYGFLPDRPEFIRELDLLDIELCLVFAKSYLQSLPLGEQLRQDLVLALACVCFRDPALSALVHADDDDPEDEVAMARLGDALFSIIKEVTQVADPQFLQ
jgi:hypothetical protein